MGRINNNNNTSLTVRSSGDCTSTLNTAMNISKVYMSSIDHFPSCRNQERRKEGKINIQCTVYLHFKKEISYTIRTLSNKWNTVLRFSTVSVVVGAHQAKSEIVCFI